MKDLKSQLASENHESRDYGGDGSKRWILITAVVLFVLAIIGIIIGIGFLFDSFLGTSTEFASQALKSTRSYTYPNSSLYDYSNVDTSADAASSESPTSGSSTITAGTVSGTTYKSAFSGITFSAPSGWTVTAGNGSVSEPDLDAHNAAGNISVKAQYFALGSTYKSAASVVSALKAQVGSDSVSDDSVHVNIGGNKFKGFVFEGSSGSTKAYSEILGADVNGYALIIQIIAPSTSNLTTVINMFS